MTNKYEVGDLVKMRKGFQDVTFRILEIKKGWFFWKYYGEWKESDIYYGELKVLEFRGWKYQFNLEKNEK